MSCGLQTISLAFWGILLLLVIMDYKCLKRLKVISHLRILRVATLCYSNTTVAAVAV